MSFDAPISLYIYHIWSHLFLVSISKTSAGWGGDLVLSQQATTWINDAVLGGISEKSYYYYQMYFIENTFIWIPLDIIDTQSTLVYVGPRCRQTTSHI